MPGSGKSTIGRILARRLGAKFVDTDDLIASRSEMPIPEIFSEFGEAGFREVEREVAKSLGESQHAVISTGGGLPMDPEAWDSLKRLGTSVYLRATVETLAHRLYSQSKVPAEAQRPMFCDCDEDGLEERVREILEQRQGVYETADLIVDVDTRFPEVVVESILESLGN